MSAIRIFRGLTFVALGMAIAIRALFDLSPSGPGSPGDRLIVAARHAADRDALAAAEDENRLEGQSATDPIAAAQLAQIRDARRLAAPRSPMARIGWANALLARGEDDAGTRELAAAFDLDPSSHDAAQEWIAHLLARGERGRALVAYRRYGAAYAVAGRDEAGSGLVAIGAHGPLAQFPLLLAVDGQAHRIDIAVRRAPGWPDTGRIDGWALELAGVGRMGSLELLAVSLSTVRDYSSASSREQFAAPPEALRAPTDDGRFRPDGEHLRAPLPLPPFDCARADVVTVEYRARKAPLAPDLMEALAAGAKAMGEPWDD